MTAKLFDILFEYAKATPDAPAFADDIKSVSYGRLWPIISANQGFLADKGFKNKTVAYKIGNQLKFAVDFLCLMATECWVIPVPPDIPVDTYEKLLAAHNISCEIDSSFLRDDITAKPGERFGHDEDNCGIYHLTSGSTGVPKLCVRSLKSLKEEGFAYMRLLSLRASVILSLPPINHSFALGAAYMAAMVSGSGVYLTDRFNARKAVEIIGTRQTNVVIAVPVMIKTLASVSLRGEYDFSNLSVVLAGAGGIPPGVKSLFKERFGVFVSLNYGSTETGGLISQITEHPPESIGKEMEGTEVRIIRQDGTEAEVGEEGEAFVRCRYMMKTYLNGDSGIFDADGFFPTGDIMAKDATGYYYMKGRKKNLINIGGKKVNPKEVEDVLLRYIGVLDCVVLKVTRASGLEAVKAVIAGEGLDKTGIRTYLSRELAGYKIPSSIEFVDKIERNVIGKIVNREG